MTLKLAMHTHATAKGSRPYQEDRYFTANMPDGFCFGVFDGHGGETVAQIASEKFPIYLAEELGEPGITVPLALAKAFAKINSATLSFGSGSTASVAFIPNSSDLVHTAVLGDSPIIVKRADQSIWVGPDHNVRSNPAEAAAATARGGGVYHGYLYDSGNYHSPGLQMARALGDSGLHRVLDRTPEINTQVLGVGSFVLICSDGAFDPGHAETLEAIDSVVGLIQGGAEAQAVVDRAIQAKTGDNVTALLVRVEAQ